MTSPSHVRAELLGEHFQLRGMIEELRALLTASHVAPGKLGETLERFASALFAHSQHEQDALRVILEKIGERAKQRNAVMDEAHVAEHTRLVTVVREANAESNAAARRRRVEAVLVELEAHMAEEEGVLLAEDLFDDAPGDQAN